MAIENADIETDLFYVAHDLASGLPQVRRRGLVVARDTDNELNGQHTEDVPVCLIISGAPEGSAEQIARALNRLPKAEAILIDVAAAIRAAAEHEDVDAFVPMELKDRADAIEEWFVG